MKKRKTAPRQRNIQKKSPGGEPLKEQGDAEKTNRWRGFFRRYYWLCVVGLIILLVGIMTIEWSPLSFRPFNGPFNGLHSWATASGCWAARAHAKYGLGYTRGFTTWALGDPPPENPRRYVDHPQLPGLLLGGMMYVFGAHDWTPRLYTIITTAFGLVMMLQVLRGLFDIQTVLLAGLLFIMFPITGYFGGGGWLLLVTMWAIWRYLILVGRYRGGPEPGKRHLVEFALALFLMVQLSWTGFFFAFTIGLHYVLLCLFRRRKLQIVLLVLMVIMPFSSLFLNFSVMAVGYGMATGKGWDWGKIYELFMWRAVKDEGGDIVASQWFSTLGKHWRTNFTWPVLILLMGYLFYLLIGRLVLLSKASEPVRKSRRAQASRNPSERDPNEIPDSTLRRDFRQIWLFLLPGVVFLLVFKGLVREHQQWLRPFIPFVAIATALGLLLIRDVLKKIHRQAGIIGISIGFVVIAIFCSKGLGAYRTVVPWQHPITIQLFQKLNKQIPPDKELLTFKSFLIKQNEAKGSFYRPEYAWYLDREMKVANTWNQDFGTVMQKQYQQPLSRIIWIMANYTLAEVRRQAETGRYPYYYIPAMDQPWERNPQLQQLRTMKSDQLKSLLLRKESQNAAVIETQRRYRFQLIEVMKQNYAYEYFGDPKDPDWGRGNTPCYIFDLNKPKKGGEGTTSN